VEQACSNIAMQRKVDDHTSYMVRSGPKCKMDGENSEHWSASKHERLYKLLHKYLNMGGYKGWTGLSPPTVYPSNHGAPSYPKVPVHPSTTPMYKETTHIPLGLRPYGSTSIEHGQTQRNGEPPP